MRKAFLYLLIFLNHFISAQNTETIINTTWQFRQQGKEQWYPAKVPGNVHTDLLQNKLIPDPFYGDNEKKVQWIENEGWEYKTTFTCDKKTISQHNIELAFEGLDTYAKVYLNGKLVLESNNMFRSWTVDVKKIIKEGENSLLVVFESAVKKGKALATKIPYVLPGEEKVFTRKAQYQYGWDWGPRLVTCGIWKPIKLITWNQLKTESVYAHTKEIKDTVAKVDLVFEINCREEGYYEIRYNIGTLGKDREQFRTQTQLVALKPGISSTTLTATIPNPKLWWCNGLNKQRSEMYVTGFKLTHGDTLITQGSIQFGIRTIELIRNKDSIGASFYFKLNGVPVFMKGANIIPQHSFLPGVTKDKTRELLMMTKEANMNMLRVWGGGTYADEDFYRDCDRAGIMVWQDFMFACAMYPGDKEFLENVKQETTEQVKRLRNHPSLALWCGNNEVDEGWHNWGWQKQFKYPKEDSAKIWNDYQKLFEEIIPAVVKQHDQKTPYWPSSPSIGWGHKESLQQGDSHYWGVWWGNEPFENYEKKVGRFMSEYGFQSLPALSTFKTLCDPSELHLNSASVKNHQKHPTGFETIKSYMEKDFVVPDEFEKFIYVSQLVQALGMKTAIEAHRRAQPYCMGTLFWQLNDCWPVTSWSCIDHFNRPKAMYYDLKEIFADVLVSVKKENDDYNVYIINDKLTALKGKLNITIKDFGGRTLFQTQIDTTLKSNSSLIYFSLHKIQLNESDFDKIYLRCEFISTDNAVRKKTLYYFTAPKHLKLPKVRPELISDLGSGIVKLKSSALIKNIYLDGNGMSFSNNYFDIEPNEEVQVKIQSVIHTNDKIRWISLNDINE